MIAHENFLKAVFTDTKGTDLPYRYYDPKLGEGRPLLIFLHGAGERGTDNEKTLNHVSPFFEEYALNMEKYGAYYLIPQCGLDHKWAETPWEKGSYNQDNLPISKYLSAAKELIDTFVEENKIDKSRIYIMGCSMGGYGTWDMITRFPDYFKAAMPICGGGDPSKAHLIKHMPIWTFHGDADEAVPVSASRDMVKALNDCGADIIYTEIPGWGHHAWKVAHDSRIVYDWLFSR